MSGMYTMLPLTQVLKSGPIKERGREATMSLIKQVLRTLVYQTVLLDKKSKVNLETE